MNEDQLNRSLEDLFSDISLPEPEAPRDAETREQKRAAAEASPSPPRPDLRADAPAPTAVPSPDVPSSRSDLLPSVPRRPQPESRKVEEEALPSPEKPLRFTAWRRDLLQIVLYGALAVGLFIVGLGSYAAYVGGQTMLLPFYVAPYLLLFAVTFWKEVPYGPRAASLLVLILTVGVLDLVQFGADGSGMVLLLTLPIAAGLFFGSLEGAIALFVSTLAVALMRWAVSMDRFVPLQQGAASTTAVGWWWMSTLVFLLLGAGMLSLQDRIVPRLKEALERGRKLTGTLAEYRARVGGQRQELKQRALQLDLLVELARGAASRLDVDGVLDRAVELIPDYLNCYMANVFLLDETGRTVKLQAATGIVGAELEAEGLSLEVADTSIVGWTARHRKPYVAAEARSDPLYRPHPGLGGTMSEVAVPLKADGFLLGVLDVQSGSRAALGEADIRLLRAVADQLAMAVQNARQDPDEVALLEATSPLYRVNRRLSGATTVDEVVQVLVESVTETEGDGCLIGALEPSSVGQPRRLRYVGAWPHSRSASHAQTTGQGMQQKLRPGVALPLSESPLPLALMEKFWTVTDVARDDRLSDEVREMFEDLGIEACVNVPLRADGRSVGHMLVPCRKACSFSQKSLRLLEVLGEQAAVALTRAHQLEEAQRRAQREELASRAAARMHESLDLESVLSTAVRDIGETLGLAALDVQLQSPPTSFDQDDLTRGNGDKAGSENRQEEED